MESMPDEKSCRACTDFKTWAKLSKQKFDSQQSTDKEKQTTKNISHAKTTSSMNNCPLDRDTLGSSTWNLLHTMAAYYPKNPTTEQKQDMKQFFYLLSKFYPCMICAKDLEEQLNTLPPQTNSQSQFSHWLCTIHNRVNKKLGKPLFNCKLLNQRWRDGWTDGSCDE